MSRHEVRRASAVRVLVVDDDELYVELLDAVLDAHDWIHVVGAAGDGLEGVALADALRPDVVLMDGRMPLLDGYEATRRLVSGGAPVRVVMVTSSCDPEDVRRALDAGATAFVGKHEADEVVVGVIAAVAGGGG